MIARGKIARCCLLAILAALVGACAAPPQKPRAPAVETEVTQTFAVARRAYERGDFAQARALYRQALTRARAIDHAPLSSDAAYNLAVSEIALQNYDSAEQLLREAGYDAARASMDTAEPLMLRAKVAYLRGRQAEAIVLADRIIASDVALALRRQATLLRGQIHAERGNLAAALADLGAATPQDASPATALAPALAADAKKLEGTIARRSGNAHAAAQLFDAEAELLRIALRYRDMAHALSRAADAYLEAGNAALAAERYFVAARSLDASGDTAAARKYLESSLLASAQANDEDVRARARALLDELSRRAAP